MKDKYIAINIGPVVKTLSLARKPRELWAASYLFSYLMECILSEANKRDSSVEVISPVEWTKKEGEEELNVGIYPDRIYMKLLDNAQPQIADTILSEAWKTFRANVYCRKCEGTKADDLEHEESELPESVRGEWLYKAYFNLMHTSCCAEKEVEAVKRLNHQLDVLELCVMASNRYVYDDKGERRVIDPQEQIIKLIKRRNRSSLFAISREDADFPVDSLAEIAAVELKTDEKWNEFVAIVNNDDDTTNPYSVFKDKQKSYHRYFCVVQADGDNMGKTFTDPNLEDGQIKEISKALNDFGKSASKNITDFGGLPIYAGGDDLLFLAPVVGCKGKDIFQLLEELNSDSFKVVRDACENALKDSCKILPTLSFGVSISYYKHPLYEALETAMNLLFEKAKGEKGTVKHKVAWELKKHSGETFAACYSKEDKGLDAAFKNLIAATEDGKTVSAVAHKSKETWKLLENCLKIDKANKTRSRIDAYFCNILDAPNKSSYYDAVKELLINLYDAKDIADYSAVFYAMLRTAKFIKGEDVKDE